MPRRRNSSNTSASPTIFTPNTVLYGPPSVSSATDVSPTTPARRRGKRRRAPLTLEGVKKARKPPRALSRVRVEADIFADPDADIDGPRASGGADHGEVDTKWDRKPGSWKEWGDMRRAAFFVRGGAVFRKGDSAIVCSSDGAENAWIAHIRGIRVRVRPRPGADGEDAGSGSNENANVRAEEEASPWVLVHWYYSLQDLRAEYGRRVGRAPGVCVDLEELHLSARERVCSDRRDILSWRVFEKVVNVVEWDERAVPPPRLTRDDYFVRSFLEWGTEQWKIAPAQWTCLPDCHRPYDPFLPSELFNVSQLALKRYYAGDMADPPRGIMLDADTMHFCARPSCRRWYHRACLAHASRYVETAGQFIPGSRPMRRLALDPSVNVQDVDARLARYVHPQMGGGKMAGIDLRGVGVGEVLRRDFGMGRGVLESVVRVAARTVRRRADWQAQAQRGTTPRSVGGYVGEVVLAQNLVHQELVFGVEKLCEHVEEAWRYYEDSWAENSSARDYITGILSESRLLACPLAAFWDALDAEMGEDDEVDDEDDAAAAEALLMCAQCSGAI